MVRNFRIEFPATEFALSNISAFSKVETILCISGAKGSFVEVSTFSSEKTTSFMAKDFTSVVDSFSRVLGEMASDRLFLGNCFEFEDL